ncbi:hypothetical protein Tco_1361834 [Tanacetum coccineum]
MKPIKKKCWLATGYTSTMMVESDYYSCKISYTSYIGGKPNDKRCMKSIQMDPTPHPMITPLILHLLILLAVPAPRRNLILIQRKKTNFRWLILKPEIILRSVKGLPRHIFNNLNQNKPLQRRFGIMCKMLTKDHVKKPREIWNSVITQRKALLIEAKIKEIVGDAEAEAILR